MKVSKVVVLDVKDNAMGNPNKEEKNNTISRIEKALFISLLCLKNWNQTQLAEEYRLYSDLCRVWRSDVDI